SGYCRICDPRPFRPLVKSMFMNDPEFNHEDLTVIMFTALCEIDIWSRKGYGIYINLTDSRVNSQDKIVNPSTGRKYNNNFLIGTSIHARASDFGMQYYYPEGIERCGNLNTDEVFGFVPALQLGGDPFPENLQRFKAMEHLGFLAQIEPLILVEITEPEPGAPLGRMKDVRRIGAQ
ncbi:T6SS immunity protein Tdi1 domain-containing protein, partial [Methylobacterium sp. A49B]